MEKIERYFLKVQKCQIGDSVSLKQTLMDKLKGYNLVNTRISSASITFSTGSTSPIFSAAISVIMRKIFGSTFPVYFSINTLFKVINLLIILGLSINLSALPDSSIVVPIPVITANNPVCENATLKLETPFQDGVIFHWYDLEGKEISVVATAIIPDMQLSMAGEYRLVAEQNGCFSDTATINIEVTTRPDTPIVFNNGPLCEGETLQLDGPTLANTTYKWIDPFGTVISNEEDPTINNIPKELSGDYFLEITQFGCSSALGGTEVGVIGINEIPELTANGPACDGDSLLIKGPHITGVTYNWTGPNGFQSNHIDSLLFEEVNTSLAGEFSLTLEASGCKSPVGKINVEVFATPMVTLIGGGNICEGDSTTLTIELSGKAPFEVLYAKDQVEQRPVNTSSNIRTINLSPQADENYTLISMADQNGCPATLTGTAAIKVLSKPKIQLITDTLCDGINENYQVQIKVQEGAIPYDFQGVEGVFNDTIFTSNLIPNETSYIFQVTDENNCQSTQIIGQYICPCSTNAGTIEETPIVICGSEIAEILHLNDAQLDANDQLNFALHDGANGLGNILATSETATFSYTDNLTSNQTYYVSPIAGNLENNQIDLSDRCLSVGQGTTVIFLPIPDQPKISGEQRICPGTALELIASPAMGEVIYSWETPIEIIETTSSKLLIDPVDADYSGDFRVALIQDGCASIPSRDYTVEVTIPSGQADAGTDTISCGNPTFQLNAKPPEFGFGSWSNNGGAFIEDPNNPSSIIRTLQEGLNTFYWMLSTEDCPNYESDSVVIAYRPNALAINDEFTLAEDEIILDINVLENDITPEGHIIWVEQATEPHQGTLDQSDDEGNFTYRRPFNGFEGRVVFDYLLCFETPTCPILCDTGAVIIDLMLDPLDPGVYVPDGITPNGDGVNDRLVIEGIENHEKNELLIFDRWGNLVFHASPYKNSWDGNYNNVGLPEGAYYYVLKTDVTNKKTLKGRVYIIR